MVCLYLVNITPKKFWLKIFNKKIFACLEILKLHVYKTGWMGPGKVPDLLTSPY